MADTPPAAESATASALTLGPDEIAALLEKLGLDPATTDVAALLAKIDEMSGAQSAAADAAGKLEAANAELEKVRGEYQQLFEREQASAKAKCEAEVDAILEQFGARLTDGKAKERIRALLLSDREAGTDILNGLPALGAKTAAATPPAPQHDPAAQQQQQQAMTAEHKAAAADQIIKAVLGEGKFTDYSSAREEARRRQPDLFS